MDEDTSIFGEITFFPRQYVFAPDGAILLSNEFDLFGLTNEDAEGLSRRYRLTDNIELDRFSNWPGIGSAFNPFTGTFDGAGFTVSGISSTAARLNAGFFNAVHARDLSAGGAELVTIQRLGVEGSMEVGNFSGGLVGRFTRGIIRNTRVDVTMTGSGWGIGGLVGNHSLEHVSGETGLAEQTTIANSVVLSDMSGIGRVTSPPWATYAYGGLAGTNNAAPNRANINNAVERQRTRAQSMFSNTPSGHPDMTGMYGTVQMLTAETFTITGAWDPAIWSFVTGWYPELRHAGHTPQVMRRVVVFDEMDSQFIYTPYDEDDSAAYSPLEIQLGWDIVGGARGQVVFEITGLRFLLDATFNEPEVEINSTGLITVKEVEAAIAFTVRAWSPGYEQYPSEFNIIVRLPAEEMEIYTFEDLLDLINTDNPVYMEANWTLMNDIIMPLEYHSGINFTRSSIGHVLDTTVTPNVRRNIPFNGIFDGNGHRLLNWRSNPLEGAGGNDVGGLFREIGDEGIVRNFGIHILGGGNAERLNLGTRAGAIASVNRGLIENVYILGDTTIGESANQSAIINATGANNAALVWTNYGTIQNTFSNAQLRMAHLAADGYGRQFAVNRAIALHNHGIIENVFVDSTVTTFTAVLGAENNDPELNEAVLRSTSWMQTAQNFRDADWDETVWSLADGRYPQLIKGNFRPYKSIVINNTVTEFEYALGTPIEIILDYTVTVPSAEYNDAVIISITNDPIPLGIILDSTTGIITASGIETVTRFTVRIASAVPNSRRFTEMTFTVNPPAVKMVNITNTVTSFEYDSGNSPLEFTIGWTVTLRGDDITNETDVVLSIMGTTPLGVTLVNQDGLIRVEGINENIAFTVRVGVVGVADSFAERLFVVSVPSDLPFSTIGTLGEFRAFALAASDPVTRDEVLSGNWMLTDDIDFGTEWFNHAIGNHQVAGAQVQGNVAHTPFTGIFDGNGFTIRNIAGGGQSQQHGIFRRIGEGGVVRNLGIEVRVTNVGTAALGNGMQTTNGGIIAWVNQGLIENVVIRGAVTSGGASGGVFVQHNRGIIRNSFSLAVVQHGSPNTIVTHSMVAQSNSGIVESAWATIGGSGRVEGVFIDHEAVAAVFNIANPAEAVFRAFNVVNDVPALNDQVFQDTAWMQTASNFVVAGWCQRTWVLEDGHYPQLIEGSSPWLGN